MAACAIEKRCALARRLPQPRGLEELFDSLPAFRVHLLRISDCQFPIC
jgi:hypothetical protein